MVALKEVFRRGEGKKHSSQRAIWEAAVKSLRDPVNFAIVLLALYIRYRLMSPTLSSLTAFMTVLLIPRLSPLSKSPLASISGIAIGFEPWRRCIRCTPSTGLFDPGTCDIDWPRSPTRGRPRRMGGGGGSGTSTDMFNRFKFSCMTETPAAGEGDICSVRAWRRRRVAGWIEVVELEVSGGYRRR